MPRRSSLSSPGRRPFLDGATAALTDLALACAREADPPGHSAPAPIVPPGSKLEELGASLLQPGTHPLPLQSAREGLVHVPPGMSSGDRWPLVVALHGAGGDAERGLALLRVQADQRGLILLTPSSQSSTWDAVQGGYGADADLIDGALRWAFGALPVDPERVAVAGFSDGGSYALGLGLANGGLFSRIVAFSPGFVPPGRRLREPEVFISHGTGDQVLPIDRTSRRIVPHLRDLGLHVTYREFPGRHDVPSGIADEAAAWLAREGPQ